jgi:hypothetical protein
LKIENKELKMKIKSFFSIVCIVVGICACDDGIPENLEFDQFKNVYFSAASDQIKRISLSVEMENDTSFVFGNVAYGGTTYSGQGNISVTIGADFSLVETYNAENNTAFEPLPETSFGFDITTLVIENGKKQSGATNLFVIPSELEAGKEYLLPVSIISATGLPVNDAKKTAYWSFSARSSEGGDDGPKRPIPLDIIPLSFRSDGIKNITVTQDSEGVTLTCLGSDPFIPTSSLGRPLSGGTRYIIAMEYKSNKASTNGQFFFCVSGGAAAGISTPENLTIPQADDWSWYEFDLAGAMKDFGFGVNNSRGKDPAEHFLRFDPASNAPDPYILTIRTFQIEVH